MTAMPLRAVQNQEDTRLPKINKLLTARKEDQFKGLNCIHKKYLRKRNDAVYRSIVFKQVQE